MDNESAKAMCNMNYDELNAWQFNFDSGEEYPPIFQELLDMENDTGFAKLESSTPLMADDPFLSLSPSDRSPMLSSLHVFPSEQPRARKPLSVNSLLHLLEAGGESLSSHHPIRILDDENSKSQADDRDLEEYMNAEDIVNDLMGYYMDVVTPPLSVRAMPLDEEHESKVPKGPSVEYVSLYHSYTKTCPDYIHMGGIVTPSDSESLDSETGGKIGLARGSPSRRGRGRQFGGRARHSGTGRLSGKASPSELVEYGIAVGPDEMAGGGKAKPGELLEHRKAEPKRMTGGGINQRGFNQAVFEMSDASAGGYAGESKGRRKVVAIGKCPKYPTGPQRKKARKEEIDVVSVQEKCSAAPQTTKTFPYNPSHTDQYRIQTQIERSMYYHENTNSESAYEHEEPDDDDDCDDDDEQQPGPARGRKRKRKPLQRPSKRNPAATRVQKKKDDDLESRRVQHNQSERNRRLEIKDLFTRLCSLVFGSYARLARNNRKITKHMILTESVSEITRLQRREAEHDRMRQTEICQQERYLRIIASHNAVPVIPVFCQNRSSPSRESEPDDDSEEDDDVNDKDYVYRH